MSSGINLVMTVIGFAVSTMFIVFVCTRLICARIQLTASRGAFPMASRSDLSILERGLHGLDPLVVANFPTKKYSDPLFSSAKDAQCTVCLVEYYKEDTLRILPFCGHSYHATCIDIWLQQHSTCPICRISLRDHPEKKRLMQPMFSSAVRYQYDMESLDTNPFCFLSPGHGLSSRLHENCRMEPLQEDQFRSEGNGPVAGENSSILIEDDQILKGTGNKHVESPSNS
ncbi:unnamed protein product [Ilex paraguariensis]|uniref:RING-type E3 ubiquitin transferase n=1 Tax=Ilex paraguariensis TaxID=185542 RepID=A0ABC8S9Z3_9AQUA